MKRIPSEDDLFKASKMLEAKNEEWRKFFELHGFTFPEGEMMNHPANISFARVVETEYAVGRQADSPLARKMFMLGYMRGHDAFPMKKDCGLFSEQPAQLTSEVLRE